jgi:hypothetical protein
MTERQSLRLYVRNSEQPVIATKKEEQSYKLAFTRNEKEKSGQAGFSIVEPPLGIATR